PTVWKRSASKSADRPDRSRYFVTTLDPGARLVFTHDRVRKPFSTAFLATRPAPIITLGLDVFVQLVMAAITILPSLSRYSPFFSLILTDRKLLGSIVNVFS